MNKIITLTKVFIKNSFQTIKTENKSGNSKKSKSMVIIYIIAFLYLAGIVGLFSYNLIESLITINQQQVFIGVILLGIAMFVLIQTLFSAMSLLYYSKDNAYILPLPLKSSQILIAKTNVLLITEYLIVIIIGVIPLGIYGILNNLGVLYYLMSLLVLIIFPIVPVLLASLLVLLIMSFSKFSKNKNRFQLFATIILIVIVFGISYTLTGQNQSEEQMLQMISKANGLVEMIRNGFPTLNLAIESLTNNSTVSAILNILGLVSITTLLYAVYVFLGKKLYLKGAIGNLSSGKKVRRKEIKEKIYKQKSIANTYIRKEFKILFRNPIFFMQCVLPIFILPIMMTVIFIAGMNSGEADITQIGTMLQGKDSVFVGSAILCAIQFFAMFIYISITAISRDGQNAVFMKYIPLSLEKQITYKAMPNIIMTVTMNLFVIVGVQFLFKIPLLYLILIAIASIVIAIFNSYIMILVDMKKPKLEWNSEYAVVKQNINLMWPAIFSMVNILVIIIYANVALINNGYFVMGTLTILYLVGTIIVKKYIQKNANKLFEKIY